MRRWLTSAAVLAALLVLAWVSVRSLTVGGAHELRFSVVEGPVRLERAGASRIPRAAEAIHAADRISTEESGRAVPSLGDASEIRVGPSSSVRVTSVDAAGVSLELEDGALEATVRPESGAVRVASQGREIATADGSFAVGVSDDLLQVHVNRGSVDLTGIDVPRARAGQEVLVIDRGATVADLPEELLLGVTWPAEPLTRSGSSTVTGRTSPGATVTFRGSFGVRTVQAERDGQFRATLPLEEGENSVEVEVTDLVGRKQTIRGTLPRRDTTPPSFSGELDYRGGR
jgi:FecR protein/Glucodextranase, domain B